VRSTARARRRPHARDTRARGRDSDPVPDQPRDPRNARRKAMPGAFITALRTP
jgi:hypothetical protein